MRFKPKFVGEPPVAIMITMGKQVIEANGGLLTFIRHFESAVDGEDGSYWLHKCKNSPVHQVDIIYVIVCNQVRYKVFYGGRQHGSTSVFMHDGEERKINWPRIVLAGPFVKAPEKIEMRGFQGFRYVYENLF